MKSKLLLTLSGIFLIHIACAQNSGSNSVDSLKKQIDAVAKDVGVLKRIKFSGYIQPQFQFADSAGQASVAGGNFASGQDNRVMVRRGRLKAQYKSAANKKGIVTSQATLQLDVTERGLGMKDANVKITDPWVGAVSLTGGVFCNPFGYEVAYSSSLRESPEYGRMSQLIFPNENEVGAMISIEGPKNSKWSWIKFNAGLFNGNGSPSSGVDVSDFDSKKDFSTRLEIERTAMNKKIEYGVGVSYYSGGFRIDSVSVYRHGSDMNGVSGFITDIGATATGTKPIADRGFTTRQYAGVDARFAIKTKLGKTTLRGEFISGEQPGSSSSTRSPNSKTPVTSSIYARNFNGAFFYLVQQLGKMPFDVVLKYDWYDPNTDVEGDEIGLSVSSEAKSTNATDIKFDTFGAGLLYHFDSNIKITAYYDVVNNEVSKNLSGYTKDIKDNVFTLRMQISF